MSLKEKIHQRILKNQSAVQDWFSKQLESQDYPFYCSFDIRESKHKMAPVDANLFPAGFNNICHADREAMPDLLKKCLNFKKIHFRRVGVFCEQHTQNPFYWDNVHALITLLESQGAQVFVLLPDQHLSGAKMESASGYQIPISSFDLINKEVFVQGEKLDFILSNNDFSSAHDSWFAQVQAPSLPPLKMGWHSRRKHSFFKIYNELVRDFSSLIGLDPFHLRVETQNFENFDIQSSDSITDLSQALLNFQSRLSQEYKKHEVNQSPYFFVKSSQGTYGLGVLEVHNPNEVLNWNYKSRKKMKASKGGGGVSSVIIQEGIPTEFFVEEAPGEAVIYLLGCGLAGGFVRTHGRKSGLDSLNAPGAVYKRMCFSDYEFQKENHILENVYGTLARIGAVALGKEIQQKN